MKERKQVAVKEPVLPVVQIYSPAVRQATGSVYHTSNPISSRKIGQEL